MQTSIEVITRWDELIARRQAWLDLLARSSTNDPMLSPQWLETWWQVFGEGRSLQALLVHQDGRLIGLAPLLARQIWHRRAVPLRRLELLATGEDEADEIYSEYLNLIGEQGQEGVVAREFVTALREGALGPWDELSLDMLDGCSPMTRALLHELRRARLLEDVTSHRPCPYIPLPATWEEYLGQMSSSRRYFLKRTLKAFEQWAGDEVVLRRAVTPDELDQGFEILVDLHGKRWQHAGGRGVFSSERFSRFHRAAMDKLLASGNLELTWLCKGDRPLAAIYNIVWDNKVYFYQSGRCTDVPSKVRPGIAIHIYAIQDSIKRGRAKYDFLVGNMRYKQQLSLAHTRLIRIRASRAGSVAAVARNLVEHGTALARVLRRSAHGQSPQRPTEDDE